MDRVDNGRRMLSLVDLTKGKKKMIVEPSKSVENEGSQKVQVLWKGVRSKEWNAEVLL